jgi:hypothetical protein
VAKKISEPAPRFIQAPGLLGMRLVTWTQTCIRAPSRSVQTLTDYEALPLLEKPGSSALGRG